MKGFSPQFTLAIIGRPNVGKSTLFNRLTGKRLALVDDQPGVTRDWRSWPVDWGDLQFTVMDTAGLEEAPTESIEAGMRAMTEAALERADIVLMLVDARSGLTPMDRHFAQWLRKSGKPVILAANKAEGRAEQQGLYESYELGIDPTIAISAEHGLGMEELAEAMSMLRDDLPAKAEEAPAEAPVEDMTEEEGEELDEDDLRLIQIAIVGRPNVGKSTLLNAILGEDRVLTGPEPGVTRDAIYVDWDYRGRRFRLVDTAGMRRRAKVTDKVEKMSVGDSFEAIRLAQVVVLVLDADQVLDKQDLTIARKVIEEGRALVVAVNKWDAAQDRAASLGRLNDKLQTSLTQVRGVPTVTMSALKHRNIGKLLDTILDIYAMWNVRVPTGQLNRWAEAMVNAHPPPLARGRQNRVRYISQINTRPPTFAVFCSQPKELPEAYKRYIINGLREDFGIEGVPIRLLVRGGKNPYADGKK